MLVQSELESLIHNKTKEKKTHEVDPAFGIVVLISY